MVFESSKLERVLRSIDEETLLTLGKPETHQQVIIVGGSALMLRDLTRRPATDDIADPESPQALEALDWELLDRLVNDPGEAAASALSERAYGEMRGIYREYRKRWCHDGDEEDA